MRFFFYGTLIAGSANPVARRVHQRLHPLGPAQVRGELWALPDPAGWYPALLRGSDLVHGRLYEATVDFAPADLAALDAYEDFDPARREDSLYLRETIRLVGGEAEAEAYRFNLRLPEAARRIVAGDFAAWCATGSYAVFDG